MLVSVLTFSVAAALLVALPGPDTLVVLRSLVRGGRPMAVRTAAGILTGLVVWVVIAVLGLTAVLRASHDAYLALRIVGAAYLVWLGIQSIRSHARPDGEPSGEGVSAGLMSGGYIAGLATDLLNPKVGIFFVTFLPGFVPAGYAVGSTSLLFGAIFVVQTAIYCALLIIASGLVVRWMGTDRIRRRMDRVMGVVFIGFGIRLAVES